jgi:hypothetical protein
MHPEVQAMLATLIGTLRHRSRILSYDIEKELESSYDKMASLEIDTFSHIRSAIFGQLMEPSYRAASLDSGAYTFYNPPAFTYSAMTDHALIKGNGSDRRRKNTIISRISSATIFNEHYRRLRDQFGNIANALQDEIQRIVSRQIAFIEADLDTLRDTNVILESEQNPEFRRRLAREVRSAREEMDSITQQLDELDDTTNQE